MKNPILFLAFLLSIGFSKNTIGQERFKIAGIAGFNLSQIDGDNFSGYDKFGLSAGLRASTVLTEKFRLDFEILYSERGSYSGRFKGFSDSPHFFNIKLNYAEIPVIASLKWRKVEYKPKKKRRKAFFRRYAANAGLSIGRLINYSVDEKLNISNNIPIETFNKIMSFNEVEEHFIKTDFSATAGASYYFSQNIGLTARFSVSLTPLYQPKDNDNYGNTLRNYYLTILGFYEL